MTSTQLPAPEPPFAGTISRLATESTPDRPTITRPPDGAPNVVLVMLDDVGFGAFSAFGGPVPSPGLDRIVERGLCYNQFHTTGLCSPSRAALITGRNHHSAHMGGIGEIAYGYPGYDGIIPKSTATIAEILRQNGYSTAMFGKAHVTPMWEAGPAGPFDRWPTGLGFDRFYGFLGGEASQWEPALYDQTTPIQPYVGRDHYHLTEDLCDQMISWIHQHLATAPNLPFFAYFTPGAAHSPHHVAPEWIEKFHGQFDGGWDHLREQTHARQLELGVIPAGTKLTSRPDQLGSWDDYPDRYKPVAARLMEVYAGFLAHTDAQVERLIDELCELGIFDDTLFIYITGDNGASAEGTEHGAWSAPAFQNGFPEDPEWLLSHMDDFGSDRCENHFNAAWAWALDAPFQWMKQVASHLGATRNGMALSWPSVITARGELRTQFHHIIDIAPTILQAAGIEEPTIVNGVAQRPIEGVAMGYSFDDQDAESNHTQQYFEILGNRALYKDGWIAACFHGRVPWIRSQSVPFDDDHETWELYDIANDFSQAEDLSAQFPEKLTELKALFELEAERFQVYPLSDQTLMRALPFNRPSLVEGVTKTRFYADTVRAPELAVINVKNVSFRTEATVVVPPTGAQGVIISQGGSMAGWALYVDASGHVVYVYNYFGRVITEITSAQALGAGDQVITVDFSYDGGGLGKGANVTLTLNGVASGEGRVENTVPFLFSMSGETLDVGMSTGSSVGDYPVISKFTGTIKHVDIEVLSDMNAEMAAAFGAGQARGALAQQ